MEDHQAVTNLELVLFELDLKSVDIIGEGFEEAVLTALEKIGGTLLFNRRMEDDPLYQRCAAVVLGEPPDQTVAVAFLEFDDRSVTVESAEASKHVYGRIALARW